MLAKAWPLDAVNYDSIKLERFYMTTFTGESCHSIGYSYRLECPKNMTEKDVEVLLDYITEWSDTPSQETMKDMLRQIELREGITKRRLQLFKHVKIEVECVHRDVFTQSIAKE